MYKFHFDEIDENETQEELIWHNIREADKSHKLELFIGASMAWMSKNPNKNYFDLEQQLRIHELDTHLYTKESKLNEGETLKIGDKICKYEIFFSCRPKTEALKEVLENSESYEDNLERLKEAGARVLLNSENLEETENLHNFTEKERENMKKVQKLEVKIRVEEISAKNILEDITNRIIQRFGKEPDAQCFGTSDDGHPMFCFTISKKMVSDVGFIVKETPNGPEFEIIQLAE